jgi:hypothetical protein
VIDLDSNLSVNPTNFHFKPSDHLPMPCRIQGIPPQTTILDADATPKTNTLKVLFMLLFNLIFPASKA